ncbi:hypothetical protein BBI15_09650 [Planococcus plakortidis]|uniref:Uncharacterized protein n=1 Tax=Planococcus plakortidis TaxID=1038856 RepID=A0A1C7E9B4_9BACL|nr:hypothetical protein BBI15_09650 [Planococcus plakortidis]
MHINTENKGQEASLPHPAAQKRKKINREERSAFPVFAGSFADSSIEAFFYYQSTKMTMQEYSPADDSLPFRRHAPTEAAY